MSDAQTTGSGLIAALEAAWRTIQEHHPELPDAVFVTGSGFSGGGGVKWGHFGADRWVAGEPGHAEDSGDGGSTLFQPGRRPEIFVSGERLSYGGELTLQTMLHEGAHALAAIREVQDTTRQGRYHNQRFLTLAREMGLDYLEERPDNVRGYSGVVLTDEARERYTDTIAELQESIRVYLDTLQRFGMEPGGDPGTGSGIAVGTGGGRRSKGTGGGSRKKAVCKCETPRSLYAAPSTLDEAPILCGKCGQPFEPEED